MHPAMQFLLFWAIVIVTMLIGYFIGAAVIVMLYGTGTLTDIANMKIDTAAAHNSLWILQLTSTTLALFASAIFFAYVVMRDHDDYLKPHFEFKPVLLLLVLLGMIISMPFMEWIGDLNQNLNLPQWMKDSEQAAQKAEDAMLQMHTIGGLISTVLFVGLLTAIVEEFLFRGVLQTILFNWSKNIHVAVWITAALFSAFHMEFFGFFPRMFLGVLFGYFVAWSGSVWTGVWGHFINNSVSVVLMYLYSNHLTRLNPDDQHIFYPIAYIISAIFTLLLLLAYRYVSRPKLTYQD